MSKAALAKVLSALEILVLEYQDDQSFQVIGHLPSWYRSLMGANQEPSAVIYLADAFPFLTYFLDDALQFWQTEQEQVLKSGLWVEVDQSGTEIPWKHQPWA